VTVHLTLAQFASLATGKVELRSLVRDIENLSLILAFLDRG
jgi:hypothetical protein